MKKIIFNILFLTILVNKSYSTMSDTTIKLLNDRLSCSLPKGYTESSKRNIMEAEASKEKEHYFKIKDNSEELNIYINELFVSTSDKSEDEIKEHIKEWKKGEVIYVLEKKIEIKKESIVKYIIKPSIDKISGNSLYCSVFIKNFDNTLISIGFYLNENALKNNNKWKVIVDKIIESIKAGNRRLTAKKIISAKTISEKNLILNISNNYGVLEEKGYGMFVTEIIQVNSLLKMPSKLTIYSGMHPQNFFKEQGITDDKLTSKEIRISNLKLNFKEFSNESIWAAECLFELEKGVFLHFILVSYDKKDYEEILKMLEKGELK